MPVLSPFALTYRSYYSDGTSSLSTLSDDLMRTKIIEEDENSDLTFVYNGAGARRPSTDRQSSIGGISSNDSLWGDARRLSEAGVRRTSDTSVILTEDTDSFIIGERVYVGGTRPGQIAYIGETQFGPGDWAGIVLDQPIGKNDGSVGGTRYFQCEAKRGIFSRLNRLTREPLADPPPPPPPAPRPLAASTPRQSTPPQSTTLRQTTPPPLARPSSRPSSQTRDDQLRIGDRVIVKSGGASGSKAGILRFRGEVNFQPGIWCGVELDEPLGKNDGSVEGFRYFICPPSHGLFAPAAKVSRSPVAASQKPSSCLLHSKTPSLRRSNSRESLNSTTSSVRTSASITKLPRPVYSTPAPRNPVQATPKLKGRDDELEELQKERDLIRTQMIKAAELVETSEKKMLEIRVEFDIYKTEMEQKSGDFMKAIKKLEEEKAELISQLEDVQFRAEEETIYKSDIQVTNEQNIDKIGQLEALLEEERKKVDQLTAQSTQLFETEEELMRVKDELEKVRLEMGESLNAAQSKASLMEGEYSKLKTKLDEIQKSDADASEKSKNLMDELQSLTSQVSEKTEKMIQLEKLYSASLDKASLLEEQLQELTAAKESLTLQIDGAKVKLTEFESSIQTKNKQLEDLKNNLDRLQNANSDLKTAVESCSQNLLVKEQELSEEKIKKDENEREISVLKKDLEDLKVNQEEKSRLLSSKEEEIAELKSQVQVLKDSNSKGQDALQQQLNDYRVKVESVTKSFEESEKELSRIKAELCLSGERHTNQVSELNGKFKQLQADNENLQKENEKMKCSIAQTELNLAEEKKNSVKLCAEVKGVNQQLLEKDFCIKNHLKAIQEMKQTIESLNETEGKLKSELQTAILEKADLSTRLEEFNSRCQQLSNQKSKLESDISSLLNSSSDSSDQLSKLNAELRDKEKELESLKATSLQHTRELEGRERALLMEMDALREDSKKHFNEISVKLRKAETALEESQVCIAERDGRLDKLQTDFDSTLRQLQDVKLELDFKSTNLLTAEKSSSDLQVRHDKLAEDMTDLKLKLAEGKNTVDTLSSEVNRLKAAEKGLVDKITVLESKLSEAQVLADEHKTLVQAHNSQIRTLEDLKIKYDESEKNLNRLKTELADKQENLSSTENDLKNILEKMKSENTQLKTLNEDSSKKILSLEYSIKEKDEKMLSLNNDLQDFKESNKLLLDKEEKLKAVLNDKLQILTLLGCVNSKIIADEQPVLESVATILEILSKEVSNLKKTVSDKMTEIQLLSCNEKELSDKLGEIQKAHQESCTAVDVHSARVKELTVSLDEAGKNLEEKQALYNRLETDLVEKNKKLDEAEVVNKNLKNDLSAQNNRINEIDGHNNKLKSDLAEKTKQVEELTSLVKNLERGRNESNSDVEASVSLLKESLASMDKGREEDKEKHIAEICQFESRVEELTSKNEALQLLIDERDRQLTNAKFERSQVQEQLDRSNRIKEDRAAVNDQAVTVLKSTIKELELKLSKALQENEMLKKVPPTFKYDNKPIQNKPPDDVNSNTFPEKEFYETQVNFLNSIIFDLKNKNDALNQRINELEAYKPQDNSDEERRVKRKAKVSVAPRLFCDICDEFDLHETEDCPQQASSDSPPPAHHPLRKPKLNQPPRSYCDICEMFDHETGDCQEEEEEDTTY